MIESSLSVAGKTVPVVPAAEAGAPGGVPRLARSPGTGLHVLQVPPVSEPAGTVLLSLPASLARFVDIPPSPETRILQ